MQRGGRRLFSALDFRVAAGEVIAVTGRNGSGKSSLLRVLAGLLRPDAGTVSTHSSLSYLGHECGLAADRTVAAELAFWTKTPLAAGDPFAVSPLLGLPVRALSQGQRRRVALNRTAASDAALWLLDEPATGLDAQSRIIFAAALSSHANGGGAAVVATHGESSITPSRTVELGTAA